MAPVAQTESLSLVSVSGTSSPQRTPAPHPAAEASRDRSDCTSPEHGPQEREGGRSGKDGPRER